MISDQDSEFPYSNYYTLQTGIDECRSGEVEHAASYRLLEIRGLLRIIN